MAFESQFLEMMQSVITYLPFTGNSRFGDQDFGTGVITVAHITYKRKKILSDSGEDRVSTAQLQMPPPGYCVGGIPTPTVSIYDQIILPFDGIQRKVIMVDTYTDDGTADNAAHHQSISLE
jgi:hypothetical protein